MFYRKMCEVRKEKNDRLTNIPLELTLKKYVQNLKSQNLVIFSIWLQFTDYDLGSYIPFGFLKIPR